MHTTCRNRALKPAITSCNFVMTEQCHKKNPLDPPSRTCRISFLKSSLFSLDHSNIASHSEQGLRAFSLPNGWHQPVRCKTTVHWDVFQFLKPQICLLMNQHFKIKDRSVKHGHLTKWFELVQQNHKPCWSCFSCHKHRSIKQISFIISSAINLLDKLHRFAFIKHGKKQQQITRVSWNKAVNENKHKKIGAMTHPFAESGVNSGMSESQMRLKVFAFAQRERFCEWD